MSQLNYTQKSTEVLQTAQATLYGIWKPAGGTVPPALRPDRGSAKGCPLSCWSRPA